MSNFGEPVGLREAGVAVMDCEHKTPVARPMGHPYIAIPDVVGGRIDLSSARRISDSDLLDWTRRTKPLPGDVLVTRRGRVGDTAVIPPDVECAIGQNLVLLRSDGHQVRQDYLRWAARSPQWWAEVDRLRNVGAVFSSLNVRDIAAIRIPVPPVGIQSAIAEVLGALDDKIAANTALVESIDGLAAVLTRSALSDDAATLASIAQVTMGSSPPGTSYNTSGKGMVFYQGVTDFGVRTPSNRMWTDTPVRTVEQGDILVSVRAPVGRINIASEPTCVGRGLAGVRSLSGRNHTLFHLLRDIPEAWQPFEAEGTIFGSISKPQLLGVRVPTVRPDLVDGLEEELQSLENRVIAAIGEDVKLAELRDALLPALMSGRLRVKDAERIAEGEV